MSISFVLVPFLILMVLLCTAVPVLLGVFVYRDANARGMEPLLWTLLAVFAPGFIGLIVYLVVRRDHFKLICPQCVLSELRTEAQRKLLPLRHRAPPRVEALPAVRQ